VRTLKTFQCTHILGASRGLLCDSSAVLFIAAEKSHANASSEGISFDHHRQNQGLEQQGRGQKFYP